MLSPDSFSNLLPTLNSWADKIAPTLFGIYGFGSYFNSGTHSESDIDLAVLCENPLDNLQRWKLQEELARALKRNIDLIDLRNTSLVMKWQVVSTGIRLVCRDIYVCDRFETYVYSAYLRFLEERKQVVSDIFEQGSVYGG